MNADPLDMAAQLTIQDLGSIGELIAAIVTIATLVYLAVQVRQTLERYGLRRSTTSLGR